VPSDQSGKERAEVVSRLSLAAGALGVASLAFVGVGSYASFTSQVVGNNKIETGTFQLEAVASKSHPPSTSGEDAFDAVNYDSNKGTLTIGPEPTVNEEGNTLSYTIPNANPGDTYTYHFSVYDVGSLQGQVNEVKYQPDLSGSTQAALLRDFTVTVLEYIPNNGGEYYPIGTTNGADAGTFSTSGYLGHYPHGAYFGPLFVQPNKYLDPKLVGDSENRAQFEVEFHFSSSAGNSVENSSAEAQIQVVGSTTPKPKS